MSSLKLKTSLLENVDGSCELSTANSKVIVSVTGPIEPKQRQEMPQQLALEVIIKPSIGIGPTTREVLMQDKLSQVLQSCLCNYLYPRKLLQVTLQVLENPYDNKTAGTNNEGSTNGNSYDPVLSALCDLNSCINASFLGIVDSAVGLKSSFVSTLIGVGRESNNELYNIAEQPVDKIIPNSEFFQSLHLVVMEIIDNKCANVLMIDSTGSFKDQDLLKVLQQAEINCLNTFKGFRSVIKDKIQKDFMWKNIN
ncbi:hypothetical protein ACO0QE_001589 [Hanseniaspora vineae]